MAAQDETKPKIPGHEITCQLKLDTNAKGWHKTISKVLKTIEGASYSIDMQNGSVTVTGMIDPQSLMARLRKSGKHAELIKVDSGVLREARIKKQKKQQQKEEEEEEYYRQLCYGRGGYNPIILISNMDIITVELDTLMEQHQITIALSISSTLIIIRSSQLGQPEHLCLV
ncbi:hypothetical protein ACLB2K_053817 [Fragaria x ananassa]